MRVGQRVLWIVIPTEEESYHLQTSWGNGGFLHNSVVFRSLLRRDDDLELPLVVPMTHPRLHRRRRGLIDGSAEGFSQCRRTLTEHKPKVPDGRN